MHVTKYRKISGNNTFPILVGTIRHLYNNKSTIPEKKMRCFKCKTITKPYQILCMRNLYEQRKIKLLHATFVLRYYLQMYGKEKEKKKQININHHFLLVKNI